MSCCETLMTELGKSAGLTPYLEASRPSTPSTAAANDLDRALLSPQADDEGTLSHLSRFREYDSRCMVSMLSTTMHCERSSSLATGKVFMPESSIKC